jgi:hypothetical protein
MLSISNAQYAENGGQFKVQVTEAGNPLPATSQVALLTVVLPPCHDPQADADGDGDVDMNDFGALQRCYTGPGGSGFNFALCRCFDRNNDGDVDDGQEGISDVSDLGKFLACATRDKVPANPACDDFPTGQVVINEMVYQNFTTTGVNIAPNALEFIELYNAGLTPVDISGWVIRSSDEVGPDPAIGFPTGDNNPDYTIPGGPGTGTTVLAPNAYYVLGNGNVPNVNQALGNDLWENANEITQLIDGNGTIKDTVMYGRNAGAVALGTPEGRLWGNFPSVTNSGILIESLSRWLDGYDTGSNGRDFGQRLPTPGASNNATVVTQFTVDDSGPPQSGTSATNANNFVGSFQSARIIDPGIGQTTAITVATQPLDVNPNAIPLSPQGGNAIIAWDNTSGGNTVTDVRISNGDAGYDLWVYFDTRDITIAGAESSVFGLLGTTDTSFPFPDPEGSLLTATATSANGSTGVLWLYQKNNAAQRKVLMFLDAGAGGDSSTGGSGGSPMDWTLVQSINMSGLASGWYRLSIAYTAATGAVVAKFTDAQHLNGTDPSVTINHTTATNLAGSFYVGYRESLVRPDIPTAVTRASLLRPPTFDVAP